MTFNQKQTDLLKDVSGGMGKLSINCFSTNVKHLTTMSALNWNIITNIDTVFTRYTDYLI